jgi:O-acetylhomoserine (thiol)-lyase
MARRMLFFHILLRCASDEGSMIERRDFGFDTRMVHAGHIPDATVGARAVPIYQTSSFVFDDAEMAAQLFELKQYGNIYTRIGNPTTAVLEERLASLEGAAGAVAVGSGMAAQFATFMTLLGAGDELVASSQLYGGTITQLTHTLRKLGVTTRFVDPSDLAAWEAAITPRTRALYGETIGNPSGRILDLQRVAGLAASHGIPLIVDSTFATPYLCRPIEHGATIVTHSATKFIGGHGTSIGGVVLESGKFDYSKFPSIADPSPSYHGLKFFETFGLYAFLMEVRTETVRDVGACLSPTAKVAWVAYAGLPDHPDHALAQKYLPRGPGAVFSFGLRTSGDVRDAGKRFIDGLQLFSHVANVGDARSLVIHPSSTTHQQLSDEELRAAGIGPELIRLSIGLETAADLLWDLDRALATV